MTVKDSTNNVKINKQVGVYNLTLQYLCTIGRGDVHKAIYVVLMIVFMLIHASGRFIPKLKSRIANKLIHWFIYPIPL